MNYHNMRLQYMPAPEDFMRHRLKDRVRIRIKDFTYFVLYNITDNPYWSFKVTFFRRSEYSPFYDKINYLMDIRSKTYKTNLTASLHEPPNQNQVFDFVNDQLLADIRVPLV